MIAGNRIAMPILIRQAAPEPGTGSSLMRPPIK
jgi:hypothetical protein